MKHKDNNEIVVGKFKTGETKADEIKLVFSNLSDAPMMYINGESINPDADKGIVYFNYNYVTSGGDDSGEHTFDLQYLTRNVKGEPVANTLKGSKAKKIVVDDSFNSLDRYSGEAQAKGENK